jgi:hypothetical protein
LGSNRRSAHSNLPTAQEVTDPVKVFQDVQVGPQETDLTVVDRVGLTEGLYDRPRSVQLVPRHAREQMVLDLIVEPAKPEIDQTVARYIAGRNHLGPEVIKPMALIQDSPPFMVRSEDRNPEDPKKGLMDRDEQEPVPGAQAVEEEGKIEREVEAKECRFHPRVLRPFPEQTAYTAHPRAECVQCRQEDKEIGLILNHEPPKPSLRQSLLLAEAEEGVIDGRVGADLVRSAVMPVMRLAPPGVTDTDERNDGEAEEVIFPGIAEDLAVPGVMPKETDLDEYEGEVCGVQQL